MGRTALFTVARQRNEQNGEKKNFTDQHHEKQKGIKEIHPINKNSALINTCRGERISLPALSQAPQHEPEPRCGSHTAVLVPQGLSVLWAQQLLWIGHVIRINALVILFHRGRAHSGLAVRNLVLGGRGICFICDGRSTDVAD